MTEGVVSVAKVVLLLLIIVPKTGKSSLKFSTHLSYFIGSKNRKITLHSRRISSIKEEF